MNYINLIAIDLAKSVFQVCLLNEHNKVIKNSKLTRKKFTEFMAQQTPTTIVMEACYSSQYWGRYFLKAGHEVKLIPAQQVTPFVRGNKNDHNDALAIAEASLRPRMKFKHYIVFVSTILTAGFHYLIRCADYYLIMVLHLPLELKLLR